MSVAVISGAVVGTLLLIIVIIIIILVMIMILCRMKKKSRRGYNINDKGITIQLPQRHPSYSVDPNTLRSEKESEYQCDYAQPDDGFAEYDNVYIDPNPSYSLP